MVFKCCVRGCHTIAKSGLHSFPSNKSIAEKWISLIKDDDLINLLNEKKLARSYHKVCNKHFAESDFQPNMKGKSELVANSVPSLFLPDESVASHTQTSRPIKPSNPIKISKSVKRLQHGNRSLSDSIADSIACSSVKMKSCITLQEPASSTNNDEENEDGWVDVDSINDIELTTNVNTILREQGERLQQQWKATETKLLRKIRDLKNKISNLQLQLKQEKMKDKTVIKYLESTLNEMQFEFVKMQITNRKRAKHGRRYSAKQKSMCLAIYRQGPKVYRFLEGGFILPTKRTLGRHSANLLFKSGVDVKVLEAIKNTVKDWPHHDKYCAISWDEVSLKEHLSYDPTQDIIEGFVELANSRKPDFATHALTFMVRGINVSFKQTTGYFYTNSLHAFELVELVELMIGAVAQSGLNPLLSVCDQVNTNSNTVHLLINSARPPKIDGQLLIYTVNGRRIIHCYDPSHLIKTVRNNLETKDLIHKIGKRWSRDGTNIDGVLQVASWDHIFKLYLMDLQTAPRLLPKLSPEHLTPAKLKMKVSVATQVFSNTCGTVMTNCIEAKKLPKHFAGTAQLLLFMNDLFDSINGSKKYKGETLKSAVQINSVHLKFWEHAVSVLSKMSYINKSDGSANNRSSVLKKFESTIRGYMELSKTCFKLDIPEIEIRDTSQDGLENFFGCVKSCGQTNKPTPREYRTGYSTMTINNITGTNSLHSNCEKDETESILHNIHEFVMGCNIEATKDSMDVDEFITYDPSDNVEFDQENCDIDIDEMIVESKAASCHDDLVVFDLPVENRTPNFLVSEALSALSHAAFSIYRKLMKYTHCPECIKVSQMTETIFIHNCINVLIKLNAIIPHFCIEYSIKRKLIANIESITTDTMGCPDHELEMELKMKELSVSHVLQSFCDDVNRFLSGKTDVLPFNNNHIQELAIIHQRKKKRIGKYSDIFNS